MLARGMTVRNRLGQRVGRLVVMARTANKDEGDSIRACWLCQCDCGNSIIVSGASLQKALAGKGGTQSCGCLMKEKPVKHGKCGTRVYRIWHLMIQRCTNPNNSAYKWSGGRGIAVCETWRDFQGFYADMGDPLPQQTIDRINGNEGYRKGNCRWATMKEQAQNRSSNLMISWHGVRKSLAQWAEIVGLNASCLYGRLNSGWTIERALSTPKLFSRKKKGD